MLWRLVVRTDPNNGMFEWNNEPGRLSHGDVIGSQQTDRRTRGFSIEQSQCLATPEYLMKRPALQERNGKVVGSELLVTRHRPLERGTEPLEHLIDVVHPIPPTGNPKYLDDSSTRQGTCLYVRPSA